MLGVIGGGAWGTALAQVIASGDEDVILWAREAEVVDAINARHENDSFLKGVPLSPRIRATGVLGEVPECEALLVVTPAQHLRSVLKDAPVGTKPLILCSKGIEAGSQMLMSDVAHAACPTPIAVLSGPTFAP